MGEMFRAAHRRRVECPCGEGGGIGRWWQTGDPVATLGDLAEIADEVIRHRFPELACGIGAGIGGLPTKGYQPGGFGLREGPPRAALRVFAYNHAARCEPERTRRRDKR